MIFFELKNKIKTKIRKRKKTKLFPFFHKIAITTPVCQPECGEWEFFFSLLLNFPNYLRQNGILIISSLKSYLLLWTEILIYYNHSLYFRSKRTLPLRTHFKWMCMQSKHRWKSIRNLRTIRTKYMRKHKMRHWSWMSSRKRSHWLCLSDWFHWKSIRWVSWYGWMFRKSMRNKFNLHKHCRQLWLQM